MQRWQFQNARDEIQFRSDWDQISGWLINDRCPRSW